MAAHVVMKSTIASTQCATLIRCASSSLVGSGRVQVGLLLKEAQDLWRVALDTACVWELCTLQTNTQDAEGWHAIERRYHDMERHIVELNLDECWKLKPLLNGQAIMKLVGVPQVGESIVARYSTCYANLSPRRCYYAGSTYGWGNAGTVPLAARTSNRRAGRASGAYEEVAGFHVTREVSSIRGGRRGD